MVQVKPFKAVRYNPQTLNHLPAQNDITPVVAPPYDVIEADYQQRLYDRHPNNVIRLILNQKQTNDSETETVYTRAAEAFTAWQEGQVLMQEPRDAFYVYTQTFTAPGSGEQNTRKGLLGLVKLAEFTEKQVFPHEATLKGPIADRFSLMQHTGANLSPVFMLYNDAAFTIEKTGIYDVPANDERWIVATEDAEPGKKPVHHAFYALTDDAKIEAIQTALAPQSLIIADGHHRYETALAFRRWVREQLAAQGQTVPEVGQLTSDWALVFLGNVADEAGLKVYPTHRLLTQWPEGMNQQTFDAKLNDDFRDISPENAQIIVKYADGSERALVLKPDHDLKGLPTAMSDLDTAVLEYAVFQKLLAKTGEALKHEGLLRFERDAEAVTEQLSTGKAVAGFMMAIPPLKIMFDVVQGGERMPQKSTYFYPKLLSGLVFNAFGPDVAPVLVQSKSVALNV
ncbi:MAG: DUF1015 domain-containing protein [Vampirovibrionales bacterium]|nr:DUF1015 domain-containing protein [Vampirovibrionales bacterium]